MNPGYLIIYPTLTCPTLPHSELIAHLAEAQLLGNPVASHKQQFYPGDGFLQLITYMGCSPAIPLGQNSEQDNCTIQLFGPYSAPQLITGSNTRPPRCPDCRHDFTAWQTQFNCGTPNLLICPECSKPLSPYKLNWRQQGGIGRQFIVISQVFPGEAVPVSALLRSLKTDAGEWDYCYIQDPIRLEAQPEIESYSE